jgi:catechol 2,3-dioxygenase-like lactoylglutathione lyase family enzyme
VSATFAGAVPILPARDTAATAAFYRDRLGFTVAHVEAGYAIVERNEVQLHFWGPSGIDPAETDGMCRIRVDGIEALYDEFQAEGLVHPNAELEEKPWGTREFAITDVDNNLVTFYERR